MKKTITFLMAFGFVLLSSVGWGQYAVNFDGASDATHASTYGFTDHTLNGITWTGVQVIIPTTPLTGEWFNGVRSARLRGYSTSHMTMTSNKANGIGTISFNYRRYGTDSQVAWRVEYSINDGSSWTQVGSDFTAPASDVVQLFSENVNVTGDARIRIIHASGGASSNRRLNIDDLNITDYSGALTPTITVSPSSLNDFTYIEGNGPSAEQSFTVSGADLTENISLAAPANYEISIGTGAGFVATDPITLAHTAGTVNATTIYVRLEAGLAAGTYNAQNITVNSTGATEKTVALSGSVIGPATTTLPYEEPFTADLGDAYVYTVAGTNPWVFATGTAEANGFGGQNPEEHWLVLPGINFGNYTNEYMTFTNFAQYGTIDANNYLKLYYSTDYAGVGDPTGATWTELSFNQPAAGAVGSTIIESASGQIDLSGLPDAQVFIAFKYFSTDAPVRWRVDDILIREDKWPVTFYVDMTNAGAFTNVDIVGSFNNWGVPVENMSLVQNNIYSYTTSTVFAAGTELSFKFRKDGNWDTAEPNPNRTYTVISGDNVYHAVYGVQLYAEISYANLQWPPSGTIQQGDDYDVFARVYANGLTGVQGDVPNLQAWIGYNTENTNPADWSNWVSASFNGDYENNEEYTANLGVINTPGVYYYASRFKLGEAGYVYGGYSVEGGGIWNGTTNVNGQLTIQNPEPTNHPTNFMASANTSTTITVGWSDAVPAADGYLIKGSTGNYTNITAPTDGEAESNSLLVQNVTSSVESHIFTGLTPSTTYYFKIYPYNGSGSSINYKADGSEQQTSGTTAGDAGIPISFFTESFGTVSSTTAIASHIDFDNAYPVAFTGTADVRNTTASSGYTGSSGVANIFITNTVGRYIQIEGINTIGYSDITMSLGHYKSSTIANNELTIQVSADGTNWTTLTYSRPTGLGTASWVLVEPTGTIPSAENLRIRFTQSSTAAQFRIDDITLQGLGGPASSTYTGTGDWNAEARWSNGVPGASTTAIIEGEATVTGAYLTNHLTIQSGGTLNIAPGGKLTAKGTLTNDAGTSGLVIQSTDAGTGSLIHNSNGVAATVQRYVSGGTIAGKDPVNYKYHLLSVPLAADIQAGDAFENTYLWEFAPASQTWSGITSLTHPIAVNKGYLGYVDTENHTYSFTGNLFNGDFTAAAETVTNGDFKLVPNPYPSAIDWELVTKNGINNAIYFFNSATGNYVSYLDAGLPGGTQYIPAGQSFFVQASQANPTVSFGNAARVHNSQAFYKSGEQSYQDVLQISVATTNAADETFIRFMPQASNSFDGITDAAKLQGFEGAPQLYTIADDFTALSINTMPTSNEAVIVPLAFELNYDTEMTLNFHYLESFEASVDIFLEDLLTNAMIDLREVPAYTFSHVATNEPVRFKLHFAGVTSIEDQPGASTHRIWTADGMLYVLLPDHEGEKIDLDIYDLQGRQLESIQTTAGRLNAIPLAQRGMLIARITAGNRVYTSKLFIR